MKIGKKAETLIAYLDEFLTAMKSRGKNPESLYVTTEQYKMLERACELNAGAISKQGEGLFFRNIKLMELKT